MSRYIIQTHPHLLHSLDNTGWNAALHAVRGGNVKILQLLADNEVDVRHKANNGWNILHVACIIYANLEMSRYIIQTYPDLLHSVDNDGWNAALQSARGGNVKLLQLLADNEVDVKHKTNNGWSILHAACVHANLEMSRYIIQTYPDLLHSVDNDGWNAALHAAKGGNIKILQLLADNEVDVKHKNNKGKNILHMACVKANLEMSRYIIQTYPALLHSVDNDGWNAALHAAIGGNVKILQLLADNEVDVKHKANNGWNILHAACRNGELEMSRYIIQTHPDLLHSVDNDGWNAALHASRGGNVKILQLLADNEVDVKHKNNDGWNILHVACVNANLEMSRYIIQTYPDLLHSVDNDGWNAALHAARGGNVKILQLLADNEVDVKHKDNNGWNILHAACRNGELEMSRYIIQTYPDLLHSVDNDGWNAALFAAGGGNVNILQLLADNEVDVKHKDNNGWNILHAACRNGELEMSRYIIQTYPDLLHSVDNDGWNAALFAAGGGNVNILQLLADNEVDVKHQANNGWNILHAACRNGELEMSRYIIQTYPDLLHSVDNDGWNAALYAAIGGNVKILQLLADNEVDVKHKNNKGKNILHMACVKANLEMSRYIIQTYPALLHSVDNDGWNAALHAAIGGNVKILQLLADNEVDVKHKANNGWNILHAACRNGELEMSRYIIQTHPDLLHSVDNDGWNAALHASRGGNVKILQLLADNEVDVKHKNNDGWNILHVACVNANLEMSRYIIQTYPDLLHSVDNDGWNAALHAARGGNVKILQLLADNEVDVKHKDNNGWNILHAACRNGELEMSRYIIQTYPDLLHSVDNDGWNAALHAAIGGNVNILQLLADNEVDVKHKDNNGWNILHAACRNGELEMSRYIIQTYPALLHSVDNDGWNAALFAAGGGNVNILQLLADNEVDVKHQANNGWNILHAACRNGELEMSRYIIQTYPALLHSVDNDGWNAAFYAARRGHVKIRQLLTEHGVKT
ncbi:ankyrin-2-like [Ostrea edulis]|uniref:ankyrin-2-like n=1 Tax=Ostrea edulis TaxID=37623 RepID=UPI0024AEDA44|nr:ankyrin-2-like [Ostrea edulis]